MLLTNIANVRCLIRELLPTFTYTRMKVQIVFVRDGVLYWTLCALECLETCKYPVCVGSIWEIWKSGKSQFLQLLFPG